MPLSLIHILKGWKHGGANHQVLAMQQEIKEHVADWSDEGQVADYLAKIVRLSLIHI